MWLYLVIDLACSLWYRVLSAIELDRCSSAISSGRAMFKFRLDHKKVVKDKVPGLSGVLKSRPSSLAGSTNESLGHGYAALDLQIAL